MTGSPEHFTTASGLRGAAASDPGRVRTNNEDLPVVDLSRGVFGVIDGVGGEAGGEIAAATAREVMLQRFARPSGTPSERVREAIAIANNEIFRRAQADASLQGMACVATVAVLVEGRLTVGHVGDTRLYLIDRNGLRKITRDHSPVGEREDAGELGEREAMRHPRRNEVFRDIGSAARDKDEAEFVDVLEEPFGRDGAFIICSDGLSDMVTADAMFEIVKRHAGAPDEVAAALIDAANAAGGKDNVTAVYVEGPAFARALRHTASAGSGRLAAAGSGRRRLVWFAAGVLAGIAGAFGLTYFAGRTQAQPSQTLVVGLEGAAPYRTIAAAMSVARAGDTIRLEPGEYLEAVVVFDGVDLVARQPGTVTIKRPSTLDPAVPAIAVGGPRSSRLNGLRVTPAVSAANLTAISVASGTTTLELLEISGAFSRGLVLLQDANVAVIGSRIDVAGTAAALADQSQASFTNSLFVRTTSSSEPAITVGPATRLTMQGNVVAGFDQVIRGLSDARRKEILSSTIVVSAAAAAPGRTSGRNR
jgi:serine/threonine protein phosphatase PrpC